jgi:hypothetical protein
MFRNVGTHNLDAGKSIKKRVKYSKHGESLKQEKTNYIVILSSAAFFITSRGTPVGTTPVVTTVSAHSLPAGT